MTKKIILIDNYDSFVHLLADEFKNRHCDVKIFRNSITLESCLNMLEQEKPNGLVFSPGPGAPEEALLCLNLLDQAPKHLPILGICLGHQCLVHYYGGTVARAKKVLHGKMSNLTHQGEGIFKNLPELMTVGRYHSLSAAYLPEGLKVIAKSGEEVMAVAHKTLPRFGVQFHPESVLTPLGGKIIENFIKIESELQAPARGQRSFATLRMTDPRAHA